MAAMFDVHEHDHPSNRFSSCYSTRNWKIFFKRQFPILSWLPVYSLYDLKGDLIAGVTVGLTVVPQGLALAQLAGLPPQYGLYTAFMGSFMYTIFGTCKDLVIGPTSVMALMTAEYVQVGGPVYAVLLTFLCGCVQLLFGVLHLGFLMNFISASVLNGFTSAAATIIATSQLKGLFGLKFKSRGFLETIYELFVNISSTNFYDMVMGISSICVLLLLKNFKDIKCSKCIGLPTRFQKIMQTFWWCFATARNAVLVIVCSSIATGFLSYGKDVFTLTQHVAAGLPPMSLPQFTLHKTDHVTNTTVSKDTIEILKDIGSGAIIIPFLSLLEAIAIAKVFSKSKRLDASREMIALGMGNLMGSFVSSYPVTGSFSRTVINNSSGVRTPLGGIFSGSLVLLALGVLAPLFHYIPKSCLSAIIFSAVIFMIHYQDIPAMWSTSKLELVPFSATFFCSLILGLEYGLLSGVIISLGMLLYKQNKPSIDIRIKKVGKGETHIHVTPDSSIYFPSIEYLKGKITKAINDNKDNSECTVIIYGDCLIGIDYTAAMGIKSMVKTLKEENITVMFNLTKPSVLKSLSCLQTFVPFCKPGEKLLDYFEEAVECGFTQENDVHESNSVEPLLGDGSSKTEVTIEIADAAFRKKSDSDDTNEQDRISACKL